MLSYLGHGTLFPSMKEAVQTNKCPDISNFEKARLMALELAIKKYFSRALEKPVWSSKNTKQIIVKK